MIPHSIETPCYILRKQVFMENITRLMDEFGHRWGENIIFGYSVKTNRLSYLLQAVKQLGWYAEVVSPDEFDLVTSLGFETKDIIYNGPQMKDGFVSALQAGAYVNLDNLDDVQTLCAFVRSHGIGQQAYHIGMRMNFDLETLCPGETTAGSDGSRFGICVENGDFLNACRKLRESGLSLEGLHLHASTVSRSLNVFETLCSKALDMMAVLASEGFRPLRFIDIGGGFFGGAYFPGKPSCSEYADVVCDTLKKGVDPEKVTLILEPGAAVLATAMDYAVSVLNIRDIRSKRIITVDGTSLHINPMLKGHQMPFTLVDGGSETELQQVVGGSTCMEADRFRPRSLDCEITPQSRLVFHCAGAYTVAHNSSFINSAPSIYIEDNGDFRLLRSRSLASMLHY